VRIPIIDLIQIRDCRADTRNDCPFSPLDSRFHGNDGCVDTPLFVLKRKREIKENKFVFLEYILERIH
jgi:hypothetical protein